MAHQVPCHKCGSARTHIVGQSATPPGTFVRCEACGHSSLVAGGAQAAPDVETRRVERLVHLVVSDKRLPCQVQTVARIADGWQVTVLAGPNRGVVRFEVKADSVGMMRSSIEHGLARVAS